MNEKWCVLLLRTSGKAHPLTPLETQLQRLHHQALGDPDPERRGVPHALHRPLPRGAPPSFLLVLHCVVQGSRVPTLQAFNLISAKYVQRVQRERDASSGASLLPQ